jgi:protein Mpv17
MVVVRLYSCSSPFPLHPLFHTSLPSLTTQNTANGSPGANTSTTAVFGPAATLWFRALSRINLSSKPLTVATRVGADQLLFTPINLTLFLSYMAYFEGASVQKRLKDKYVPVLKTNWMVWPAVQSVNFAIVPLEHRVLVVNVVAIGWNCYLSWMNSKA